MLYNIFQKNPSNLDVVFSFDDDNLKIDEDGAKYWYVNDLDQFWVVG